MGASGAGALASGVFRVMTEECLKEKKAALFFTEGVSLKSWAEAGILSREIAFYNKLSQYLAKIYFLTYGGEEDYRYQSFLSDNIEIIPALSGLSERHHVEQFESILEEVDFLRTHQVKGADLALRLRRPRHRPLIVRSGYIWSLHHRLESRNPFSNWQVVFRERKVFKQCDAILCASEAGRAHARRLCGDSEKPIGLIPNYVDTSLFNPLVLQKRKRGVIFV